MLQERTQIIMEELEKKGIVKVAELSAMLNCSDVTIRSDIKKLEDQGLLQRTHGGAVKVGIQMTKRFTGETIPKHADKKIAIAKQAYEFIEDNDTIIIDDASTSLYMTKFIKEDPSKHVVVVTNSLLAAMELKDVAHVDLFIVGGQIAGSLGASMGDMTIDNIANFYVDKAFIGVKGINFKVGITSIAYPQMQVKRAIMKASKQVYVLADSSKFGGAYLSVICPIDQVTKIITDSSIQEEYRKQAQKVNAPIVIVS